MSDSDARTKTWSPGAWAFVAIALGAFAWGLLASLEPATEDPEHDARIYLRDAAVLAERGPGVFRDLYREYVIFDGDWIYPPPSRVGYIALAAAAMRLFGGGAATLAHLSIAAHLALIATTFLFARRWISEGRAAAAAVLTGASPLLLGLSRLPLTDSVSTLTQTICLALFLEHLRAPGRLAWRVAFVAAFAASCLTKEIAVLLAIPFTGVAAIRFGLRDGRRELVGVALMLATSVSLTVATWWLAAGEWERARRVVEIVMSSPATNAFAQRNGSGGWFRYPIDQVLASPWTSLIGLGAVATVAYRWLRGEFELASGSLALVCIGLVAAFTKNLRYVAVLEVPLRLLAVGALFGVAEAIPRRAGRAALAAVFAAILWSDLASFRDLWLRAGIEDPTTRALAYHRRLLDVAPRAQRRRPAAAEERER